MAYRLPDHVLRREGVQASPPYAWDDWDPYSKIALPDPALKAQLTGVSNLGITAFALGCAEWVVGALPDGEHVSETFNYLEAFWVYVFGFPEAVPPETEDDEWKGPVRGAINLSLMTVLNTIVLAEFGPPAQNGAFAARIAAHVLTDMKAFLNWQNEVVERLLQFCKRSSQNEEGDPLPRELLDTARQYDANQSRLLIQDAIDRTDFSKNPLLRSLVR